MNDDKPPSPSSSPVSESPLESKRMADSEKENNGVAPVKEDDENNNSVGSMSVEGSVENDGIVSERDKELVSKEDTSMHTEGVAALKGDNLKKIIGDDVHSNLERVRQRLRQKEKNLSLLLSAASPTAAAAATASASDTKVALEQDNKSRTELEQQVHKLEEQLETGESKRAELEGELTKLKNEEVLKLQEELETAKQQLQFLQDETTSRAELLEDLEYQVLEKNSELDTMREQLTKKLKRVFELEVDLQFHELNLPPPPSFSQPPLSTTDDDMEHHNKSTEDDHHQDDDADTKSKRNLFRRKAKDDTAAATTPKSTASVTSSTDDNASKKRSKERKPSLFHRRGKASPHHAQQQQQHSFDPEAKELVTKLHGALKLMERRYKEAKLESALLIEELEQENQEYRRKIISLEKCLKESSDNWNEEFLAEDENTDLPPSARYWKNQAKSMQAQQEAHVKTIEKLSSQVKAMKQSAEAHASRARVELGRVELEKEALQLNNNKAALESSEKVKGLLDELENLRQSLENKDRKMEALQSEVVQLRMEERRDSTMSWNERPYERSPQDAALISQLETQLKSTQQLLYAKDQQLDVEKEKASKGSNRYCAMCQVYL